MTTPVTPVNYFTPQDLRDLLRIRDGGDDDRFAFVIPAACQSVENVCGRRFWKDDQPSAHVYAPQDFSQYLEVDDFDPTAADPIVATDEGGDGTFETVWARTDFELGPLNPTANGPGAYREIWPINRWWPIPLRPVNPLFQVSHLTPLGLQQWDMYANLSTGRRRALVQVIATWGWSEVPPEVIYAAALTAVDLNKSPDAPFGVAGSSDFGVLRVRQNQTVMDLLSPYMRTTYVS